jgi:predicted transcriptional regulator
MEHCLCCWPTPSKAQRQDIDWLEKEVQNVRAMKNYVRARYESNDPYTAIAAETIPEYDSNRYSAYMESGTVLYPIDDLYTAGGCGGGVKTGGSG